MGIKIAEVFDSERDDRRHLVLIINHLDIT